MQEQETITLPSMVSSRLVFKGMEDTPLLAPRGVYTVAGKLIVADTAQNRVFIWNKMPTSEYAPADIILGQSEKADTGRNASGQATASSLFYPSGLWSDGERLVVSDAWNHRVLIWNQWPSQDGQEADIVLGQPDFISNQPNVEGVSKSPSAQSLNWPYGVFSDGERLWVADTGNRRVLQFDQFPTTSFASADKVIGKETFEERDYDHLDPIWPYSIKIGPQGQLAVTDTQYYRVLIWNNWETAYERKADVIIGQESFEANGQNQFGWFPEAHSLNWCYDTCFYKEGIWVADTGNSRVLWHPTVPTEHNSKAVNLLGQDNFTTGSENKNTIWSTEGSLYWPFQISIDGQTMAVADTGNHRIIINQLNF